jgi:hypothetical protein
MRRFGVEIEFIGDLSNVLEALRETELVVIDSRHTHNTGNAPAGWALKRDGSVQGGGELVSPPLDFDDADQRGQVNAAVDALLRAGATTHHSAGIHVHIEAKNDDGSVFTGRQIGSVVRFGYKFEDAIYRIASSGWESLRPGARSYAKPVPEEVARAIMQAKTLEDIRNVWDGYTVGGRVRNGGRWNHALERYYAVNLRSFFQRGTIEFRYFNSSLNATRIQTYIALCAAIVEDARRGQSRSVAKSFPLGGMHSGQVCEKKVFLRLQQILTTTSGDGNHSKMAAEATPLMSKQDWKNLRTLCWKDSKPQPNIFASTR